jgi:tetratricopeptide (TPR) repeat protein
MNRRERRRNAKTNAGSHAELLSRAFRHHRQGQLAAAETLYRQVLQQEPGQHDAMRLLGEVLIDQGRGSDALTILKRLVSQQPGSALAHYSLSNALRFTGQTDGAIAGFQKAVSLSPNFAEAHHALGLVFRKAAREAEAAASFRRALHAKPDWAEAWKDLGLVLAILGDLPAAEAALRRAIMLRPGLAEAQRLLATIRTTAASSAEQAALLERSTDPASSADETIDLKFALARQEERALRFDAAFGHFAAANALLRAQLKQAGLSFDRVQFTRDIDKLIATFTPDIFTEFAAGGSVCETPVFIVGMPRTGSSLFEQIAASHTHVFGAGEYTGIGAAAARIGWAPSPQWAPEGRRAEAELYLGNLPAAAMNARRIIDKMPDNIFHLGLIAALFPRARVIFCARDWRDTILSCFFQRFSQPLLFDTDLQDCAFRLEEIERLTAHWRRVLPLRHITMSYEALLDDPEGQSRALIEFLGLEWESQCLEFHRTQRPVRTASWAQVRQPLYQDAKGRWRHYEQHLTNNMASSRPPQNPVSSPRA